MHVAVPSTYSMILFDKPPNIKTKSLLLLTIICSDGVTRINSDIIRHFSPLIQDFVYLSLGECRNCAITIHLPDFISSTVVKFNDLLLNGQVLVDSKEAKNDLLELQVILGCGVISRAAKITTNSNEYKCAGCKRYFYDFVLFIIWGGFQNTIIMRH